MMESSKVVVIDAGSAVCKAGFAGQEEPQVILPTVVAFRDDRDQSDILVGNDALSKVGSWTIGYPIERAITKNGEQMAKIYERLYEELGSGSKEAPVLLSETPLNPVADRKRKLELFFETFGVPSLAMSYAGVLALYSASLTSGVVLDVGDGVTQLTPVYEGQLVSSAVKRFDFGSRDVTQHLRKLLEGSGKVVGSVEEARRIKEELCFVSTDYPNEIMSDNLERTYTNQSGDRAIELAEERITAPEILFNPEIIGLEVPSIPRALYKCITGCEIDIRKSLYDNVVVCGGGTLLPGFVDRLEQEVNALAPRKVNLIADQQRHHAVFRGASKMACAIESSAAANLFVSKHEYEETGTAAILEKLCCGGL